MHKELIAGTIGTTLGVVGTATQTQEVLQIVSLIITIIGGIISMIIVPLLSWYVKVKKDGKITAEEVKEGAEILGQGIESVSNEVNKQKGEEPNEREHQQN